MTLPHTGFIIDGQREYPQAFKDAGIVVRNYLDDPRLKLDLDPEGGRDGSARSTAWIRGIVFHTTRGRWPQEIRPGVSPSSQDGESNARYWSRSSGMAGAHLIVDSGREILPTAGLSRVAAYHAGGVNDVTIGVEIVQFADGLIWEDELDPVCVLLADFLTLRFEIQRQFQELYHGGPCKRLKAGGADCVGLYGHRDQTDDRGRGDPGDALWVKLRAAGYEGIDFERNTDVGVWKARQRHLNTIGARSGANLKADGIPGPATAKALRDLTKHPLWVHRPFDNGYLHNKG